MEYSIFFGTYAEESTVHYELLYEIQYKIQRNIQFYTVQKMV